MAAAKRLTIKTHVPYPELYQDGWAKSRTAANMVPAGLIFPLSVETGSYYCPSTLPDALWREPNTGVIMLKPAPIRIDYWETSSPLTKALMGSSEWRFAAPVNTVGGMLHINYNSSFYSIRQSPNVHLIDLEVTLALQAIIQDFNTEMHWVMESKQQFAQNEGWAMWVYPPGIYTDRAVEYAVVYFGRRYALIMYMNGTAALKANMGTTKNPKWVKKAEFAYASGGIDHGKPFQITVIPWGFTYITFLFSQASTEKNHVIASGSIKSTSHENSFLYDIRANEGKDVAYWDNSSKQYVKTPASTIAVALRGLVWNYGFALARVRYPTAATLTVMPERIGEPHPKENPTLVWRGFDKQKVKATSTGPRLTSGYVSALTTTWDKNTDSMLVPYFTLTPDADQIYTPELWSYDLSIPEDVRTPGWVPQDISARYRYLRFTLTTELDQTTAQITLGDKDSSGVDTMLKNPGPIQIIVRDHEGTETKVFHGYTMQCMPTLKNPGSAFVQINARDMWSRLNEKYVGDFLFLDGSNVADGITNLLKRAGFASTNINLIDPDGYLRSLTFEGFVDPNDQKQFNQDCTVGDALREIFKAFSIFPIRLRWYNDKWNIYLAPQWTPGTVPQIKFFAASTGHEQVQDTTDTHRWDHGFYKVTSDLEFTVAEPNFNGLLARSSDGTGKGSKAIESIIPATYVDSRSLTDPTYYYFMGRAKVKVLCPPELTAQTQKELDALSRIYWERNSKAPLILEFEGEWQPSIDVDDFVWVCGQDHQGNKESYGVYRIDNIDIEMDMDISEDATADHPAVNTGWSLNGRYTCVYVGKTNDPTYPMFTDDTNLPPEVTAS